MPPAPSHASSLSPSVTLLPTPIFRLLLSAPHPMTYLLLGLSLGLSAGIAPGPLLALVLQRSLSNGALSGVRVSLAPLLTDLPIVFLAFILVGRLSEFWLHLLMGIGGLFVLWLAIAAWRNAGRTRDLVVATSARQDLLHGALVNFLNPHPYLFWITVGAPTVVQAWRRTPWAAVGFVVGFYALLLGSKITLALFVSRAHSLNRQRQWLRFSAVLLLFASVWMLYSALHGLGWLI